MKTLFIDGGRKRDASFHSSPSPPATSTSSPPIESATDTHRKLYRSHTLRLNKPEQLPNPLPYLDVLSLDHFEKYPRRQAGDGDSGDNDEAAAQQKLEDLLESVHLLLEPIQIPDLSHTGVFDTSTSQLQTQAAESTTSTAMSGDLKLSLSSVDKESEIKLFYPTAAKKANMREYIKETIHRHLASQSYADLTQATAHSSGFGDDGQLDTQISGMKLAASVSEPAFVSSHTFSSPSKSLRNGPKSSVQKASKASSPSPAKHKKPKFASNSRSPQKSLPPLPAGVHF